MSTQILSRGESVYKCDTCNRKVRISVDKYGLEVVQRCVITQGCQGKLHKLTTAKDINNTAAVPPAVEGLDDWFPRKLLYNHTQGFNSTTWTIRHNLGCKPTIHVYVNRINDENETIQVAETPENTTIVDLNTIILTFSNAESGTAQCISFSSSIRVSTQAVVEEPEDVLLTHNGEITLATLITDPLIGITITYNSPILGDVPVQYINVDDVPSVNSAWVGTNTIFVGGKVYDVRSFNLVTHQLAPATFRANKIVDGTTFSFTSLPTTPGQTLILLSIPPFSSFDKVVDKYIDCASINPDSPEVYYYKGNGYAYQSIVRNLYPSIVIVD